MSSETLAARFGMSYPTLRRGVCSSLQFDHGTPTRATPRLVRLDRGAWSPWTAAWHVLLVCAPHSDYGYFALVDDGVVDESKAGYSGFVPVLTVHQGSRTPHRAALYFWGSAMYYADPNGDGNEQEPQELIMLRALASHLGKSWGGVLDACTNYSGILGGGNCVPAAIVIETVVAAMGPRAGLRFLRDVASERLALAIAKVHLCSDLSHIFAPLGVVRELGRPDDAGVRVTKECLFQLVNIPPHDLGDVG